MVISLGWSTKAAAHGGSAHAHEEEPKPAHGYRSVGLGYMQLGTFVGAVAHLGPALSRPGALGDGAKGGGFGYTIGGGGRQVFAKRFVIGGRGFGFFEPRFGGPQGTARVTAGGGGLELGVAAVNQEKWLFIPYLGAGGYGMTLTIANESAGSIAIAEDEPIPSGGTREYAGGAGYIEVGAATHRLFFFGGTGGFAIGFDVGAMFSVAESGWSREGNEFPTARSTRLSGGFLRLTIGGGGGRAARK